MKRLYTLFLFSLFFSTLVSQTIPKKTPPTWVNSISPQIDDDFSANGAYDYLLLDFQDNISRQEQYAHYAVKVLNSEGIQEFSDISVSFDPSFQELIFHQIRITRNREKIDKLESSKINVFQRESNLQRALYDGSLTAVINLTDIRKGDVIEYAYTIKGFNPINKGHYSALLYQQYTAAVSKIYHRVITKKDRPLQYKLLDGAVAPKISQSDGLLDYNWEIEGTDYYQYDINVPYWLNLQKRVSVSTFKNWNDVVKLTLPLYDKKIGALKLPEELSKKQFKKEDKILKLIRFVQDDVRYLGFESGIGAYQPNHPKKVLNQRYGDCKDKSLLLVSLLRKENVAAFPFLVNTESRNALKELLPSHNLFNHCIVKFNHNGKSYFVDPTMTGQGGNLDNLSIPKYGFGLVIKSGNNDLTALPEYRVIPKLKVEETITTDSIGGSAVFLIKSTYSGSKADQMRDYFNSNSLEAINKEFVNYYSSLYPSIEASQPIRFSDNTRNGVNEFIIEEYYAINRFWQKDETTGLFKCETEPMVLESMLEYSKSPKRNTSYYLGEPYEFEQKTTVALPQYWNITSGDFEIEKNSFKYQKEIRNIGKTIEINHSYTLKTNQIPPEEVSDFLENHEKINNQISYQLTHPGGEATQVEATDSGLNWVSIIIALIVIGLGVFFSKKIYERYDPAPLSDSSYTQTQIGGWLVLPGIGLVLTPLVVIFQLAQNGYFDNAIWSVFHQAGYENATALTISVGFELVYNLCLLVFTVLLVILYFKKRTSLPKLIIIFYTLNVIMPLLELVLVFPLFPDGILGESDRSETYGQITRSFIGAAIWIPYFMVSERVKDTFKHTYTFDKTTA